MAEYYADALELMKADPAITEMSLKTAYGDKTLFRADPECIVLRHNTAGYAWNDIVWLKTIGLQRSSAVNNVTEEELAAERLHEQTTGLRIKTPPRSEDEEEVGFTTPTRSVRRVESPPPLCRPLPPPCWPLMRCCATGCTSGCQTVCSEFAGIRSPTPTPTPAPPASHHLFFDPEGNIVSYEEHVASWAAEEEEEQLEFAVNIPRPSQKLVARHPRVLLAYFRFIQSLNEVADEEEIIRIPRLPEGVYTHIARYLEQNPAPLEFAGEEADLWTYLFWNLEGRMS